jgi:DNA-binding transcriptional LysR family regulator
MNTLFDWAHQWIVRLPQLAIFAAVANLRGFRSASASLGLSPSAVSHAVSELEAKLACRLFQRSTRSLALTEAGARLLERLGPALSEIEQAVRDAGEIGIRPRGRVRITAQHIAAEQLLAPHLAGFLSACPEISLEIMTDDRFVDLVAEGYDAGIRLGEHLEPDMVATRIGGQLRLILVLYRDVRRAAVPRGADRTPVPAPPLQLGPHL